MKTHTILLLLCCSSFAYADKAQDIREFVALQSKVLEIAKAHQADPFKEGSSTLKDVVKQKIDALQLESLSSEQLYRLGIACSVSAYPQEAGDLSFDLFSMMFAGVALRLFRPVQVRIMLIT